MYRKIGERVRQARKRAHVTQDSLAATIGHTRDSVARIETARQRVQVHTLYQIAALFGIGLGDLLPDVDAAALVCSGQCRRVGRG